MCLISCEDDPDNALPEETRAYVPVYMTTGQKNDIHTSSERPTEKSGKDLCIRELYFSERS